MGEDTTDIAVAASVTDEEARLKDKLEGKKVESALKKKLIAKKERRHSESDSPTSGGKDKDSHSPASNGSGRDRRSSSSQRYVVPHRRGSDNDRMMMMMNGRGGPHMGGRGGRGGRGGHWGGPSPRGGHYFEPDPYGRGPPPDRYGRGPPPGFRDDFGRGPPPHHRGGPFYDEDPFGRAPPRHHQQHRSRSRSRSISARSYSSRSRSLSRSYSRSRSRSRSPGSSRNSKRARSQDRGRGRRRNKHRRRSRSRRSRSPSTSGSSVSSTSSSSSSSDESEASKKNNDTTGEKTNNNSGPEDSFTKDQRTVFVNQLVMRTTARDIKRYFRKKVNAKVLQVELLTDRRTGKHKGCAYVEMKSMEDVTKALNVSGQAPDFQRFPILIKPSEAEKNYLIPASSATVTANMMGVSRPTQGPLLGPNGLPMEAQKVYCGNLDSVITQEHLFKLFSQIGELNKVQLQMEPASGLSKGFAFLSFRDPKEANLAIATMSNQVLAGKPMKTGWATQQTGTPGVAVVTTEEFPVDASARVQKARVALAQLAIGAVGSVAAPAMAGMAGSTAAGGGGASLVPTVADARNVLAANLGATTNASTPTFAASLTPTDAKVVGRAENPSQHLLIANMFDKDEETEPGWAEDIKEEFKEECQKFGNIENVLVMSKDPGGKIYASFDAIEAAKTCASSLAGRWFDKRQLRVEFVNGDDIPKEA